MGRQINFYMSEDVQNEFIDFLISKDFMFFDNKGNKIEINALPSCFMYTLYKNEFGELWKKNDSIDDFESPIIQFIKTRIRENTIHRGRLWVPTQKDRIRNIQPPFNKTYITEYDKLVRWIKKKVPYQEVQMGSYKIKEYANDIFVDIESKGYDLTN